MSRDDIKDARAHCKVGISGTTSHRVAGAGGTVTVKLTGADAQCVKAVSTSEDWAVASLRGGGVLAVSVAPNEEAEPRTVTIYVASITEALEVVIDQAGQHP